VCVLTGGHLSTSPRMLKVADTLARAGYRVRVVSARHTDWATETDRSVRRLREGLWSWRVIDFRRDGGWQLYFTSGVRSRSARWVGARLGSRALTVGIAARARDRIYPELVSAVLEEPADLIYGGGSALAATAESARRMGVPFALDLEDFHTGEYPDSAATRVANAFTSRIEREVLPRAALLTAGSKEIANAYLEQYGVTAIAINNSFPLPDTPPDTTPPRGQLRLYWFSQTIGSDRGLEEVVRGIGVAGIEASLHLRGRPVPGYLTQLSQRALAVAPRLRIVDHAPGAPDEMVNLCRGFDIGLATEVDSILNKSLSLSNKALTYILAGLAVAMTDTKGQHELGVDLGEGALLFRPGDVDALGDGLARWDRDRQALGRGKAASWAAAKRRWNWGDAHESGKLVESVKRVLDSR
jgi:glycosyltransferase involved in cell wall biosynthesis